VKRTSYEVPHYANPFLLTIHGHLTISYTGVIAVDEKASLNTRKSVTGCVQLKEESSKWASCLTCSLCPNAVSNMRQVFGLLQVSESGANQVVLRDVQIELAGKYRCEVSADAPTFHTEVVASHMYVACKYPSSCYQSTVDEI
jgi:hypothetical protein